METGFNFKGYGIKHHGKNIDSDIKYFLQTNHYKKSARGLKQVHVFTLWHDDLMVGVAVFGQLFGRFSEKIYGKGSLELRRFCLITEAPKNSESFFLSKCLKHLKKLDLNRIISFADPSKGHQGVIYKASNFKYLGVETVRQQVLRYKGKDISMRMVYQRSKINGEYMQSSLNYQALKAQGKAKMKYTKPKHIYSYDLKDNK